MEPEHPNPELPAISNSTNSPNVAYIVSNDLIRVASLLPSNSDRSMLVHSLIKAYNLFDKMRLVKPQPLSAQDLKRFHSADFVDFLMTAEHHQSDHDAAEWISSGVSLESEENEEDSGTYAEKLEEFGLEHVRDADYIISQILYRPLCWYKHTTNVSTIVILINSKQHFPLIQTLVHLMNQISFGYIPCDVHTGLSYFSRPCRLRALRRWGQRGRGKRANERTMRCGGMLGRRPVGPFDRYLLLNQDSFVTRSEANGFCYVSDITLAIIELGTRFDRVMYVDLDVHHGDGVESAFLFSNKVLTLSLHHYSQGFYPGTGALTTVGKGKGIGYTLNVPLKAGLRGATLERVFEAVVPRAFERFEPDVVVIQCGADGLTDDPVGKWNVSIQSFANCVQRVVELGKPVLLLGGGGYNSPNVARCYAHILSRILRVSLKVDIPEHAYFEHYTPDFSLFVDEGNQRDWNDETYVEEVIGKMKELIDKMR
ncbi:hypothetical protein BC937DRAFT_88598 [Endogone sp. FLAS-F59071]|nr:hypothetical protein BC937DRAFT_88598 [Endogone sp. FLAS-F59071]|eukprot:RUS18582.1 hypothetical protein BC937DRAFT_88598 [Endogone sp. FLAS-F59071]